MLVSFVCAVDLLELLTVDGAFQLKSSGWLHPADFVDDLRISIPGTPGIDLHIEERNMPSWDVAMANPDVVNGRFRIDTRISPDFNLSMERAELKISLKHGHEVRLNIGGHFTPTMLSQGDRDLVMGFESLGDNCEFGLLQRQVGFERLSLFRYAGSPSISALIKAIEDDFSGFATGDDLVMEHFHDMWDARSQRYGFQVHTYIYRDKMDADAARQAEGTKLSFMAGLLVEDLETAHKIFVRRGREDGAAGVRALHRAMRKKGPNRLLWVEEATESHPHGFIETLEEGLFRGFISKLTPYAQANTFDVQSWVSLLKAAKAFIDESDIGQ